MLLFNYGHYEFWEAYNPSNDTWGTQKVVFDGIYKIIYVSEGILTIDVQDDIYSAWKEWVQVSDNAKYIQALSAVGGDPITDTQFLGTTYFLENGWRLKPWDSDVPYILSIDGNIFTREPGQSPVLPAINASTSFNRSNLVDLLVAEPIISGNLEIGEVTVNANSVADIANNVWEEVVNSKGTKAREQLGEKIATKTQDIALS
jgi:hypothetical protein